MNSKKIYHHMRAELTVATASGHMSNPLSLLMSLFLPFTFFYFFAFQSVAATDVFRIFRCVPVAPEPNSIEAGVRSIAEIAVRFAEKEANSSPGPIFQNLSLTLPQGHLSYSNQVFFSANELKFGTSWETSECLENFPCILLAGRASNVQVFLNLPLTEILLNRPNFRISGSFKSIASGPFSAASASTKSVALAPLECTRSMSDN